MGSILTYIIVHALDEQDLKAYAKAIGVDYHQLTDPEHITGIVIDSMHISGSEDREICRNKGHSCGSWPKHQLVLYGSKNR